MMSNSIEIDEIISNLRATITSNKGGVQLNCIESDYYNLIGEQIQYQKLGYNSLVEFLESLKVFKIKKKEPYTYVFVVSDGKTQHLENMIKKQKTKSKRSKSKLHVIPHKNLYNGYNSSMDYKLKRKIQPVNNFVKYTTDVNPTNRGHFRLPTTNYDYKLKRKIQPVNNFVKHTTDVNPTNRGHFRLPTTNYENKLSNKKDKFKGFAQDRLQKYEKKDFNQIENEELKSETLSEEMELSEIFTKKCNIHETMCNISMQPKQIQTFNDEQINLEIDQYTLESKCKKIVTVTAVFSPSSICVVMEDDNNDKSLLRLQMEFNRMKKGIQTPININPFIGYYYALYHHQKWYRIVVESIDYSNSIKCFLIDTGRSIIVNRDQIYSLEPEFFQMCGQAVQATLNKLNLFNKFPFIKEIVVQKLLETKCVLISNSVITYPPTVTLYDLETKMNINDMIINSFFEKVTPKIDSGNGFDSTDAKLISIVDGYCFLQFNQDLIRSLEKLFSTNRFLGPRLKNSRDIDYKDIYLAYYERNIKGRVKVNYFISESQVKVFFIDYGCFKIVEVGTLIDLYKVNVLLVRIPSQAVKVALHMFPPEDVTRRTEEELFKILGNNTNVSIYTLKDYKGQIPCVQLWSIVYPDTFINIILYSRLFNYTFNQ